MPLTVHQCQEGIRALKGNLLVPLDQSNFFTQQQAELLGAGVCRAICVDWIRRKLFANKASFAVSKKGAGADPLEERLSRKGPRLANAHAAINQASQGSVAIVNALILLGHKWAAFTNVSVAELGDGPRSLYIPRELRTDADCDKGKAMFQQLLDRCLAPPQNRRDAAPVVTPAVRQLLNQGREDDAVQLAAILSENYPSACFLIDLDGHRMKKAMRSMQPAARKALEDADHWDYLGYFKSSGHSIALEVNKEEGYLQYLDPNLGEYRFPMDERARLVDLFNYMWNLYALSAHVVYDKFTIAYFN